MAERAPFEVVVAAYGPSPFLTLTLESIVANVPGSVHVTLLDDCSPDDSVRQIGARFTDRVRYMRNEMNLGTSGSFNEAMRISQSLYTVLVGPDDLLLPRAGGTYTRAIARGTAAAAIHPGVQVIDETGAATKPLPDRVKDALRPGAGTHKGQELAVRILLGNWTYNPAIAWRTDLVESVPFDRVPHDGDGPGSVAPAGDRWGDVAVVRFARPRLSPSLGGVSPASIEERNGSVRSWESTPARSVSSTSSDGEPQPSPHKWRRQRALMAFRWQPRGSAAQLVNGWRRRAWRSPRCIHSTCDLVAVAYSRSRSCAVRSPATYAPYPLLIRGSARAQYWLSSIQRLRQAISSRQASFRPCLSSITRTYSLASCSDRKVPVSSQAVPRGSTETESRPWSR